MQMEPTYAKTGGADNLLFTIDNTTGVLNFVSARDFENPTDNDTNGVYEVTVQVSDGTATDTQTLNVTVTNVFEAPSTLNFGAQSGINLNLINPLTTPDGKVYYILDNSGDNSLNAGDKIDHILLDTLLNGGSNTIDTQVGNHNGTDDQRSVILAENGSNYALVLPTSSELQTLYNNPALSNPPWNNLDPGDYWSSTQAGPDSHETTSLDDPFTIINANDNISQYIAFQVIFV